MKKKLITLFLSLVAIQSFAANDSCRLTLTSDLNGNDYLGEYDLYKDEGKLYFEDIVAYISSPNVESIISGATSNMEAAVSVSFEEPELALNLAKDKKTLFNFPLYDTEKRMFIFETVKLKFVLNEDDVNHIYEFTAKGEKHFIAFHTDCLY